MRNKILIIIIIMIIGFPIITNARAKYLYDVFSKASSSVVKEYTDAHHDSFTEEPTHKIYYWLADDDIKALQVMEKNNVIFANHCWKMIRTTDTGGVKLLYNGPVINNNCVETTTPLPGYTDYSSITINNSLYYSDKYSFDSSTKKFSLDGNIEKIEMNADNQPNIKGKYTCLSTNQTATCSPLYLISSFNTNNSANALLLNTNTIKSQYGKLPFNKKDDSLAYVGYKYGDVYTSSSVSSSNTESLLTGTKSLLAKYTLSTSIWFSDSISCDSETNNCILVNPYKVSSESDYSSVVGKYTFFSGLENTSRENVSYIVQRNGKTAYTTSVNSHTDLTNFAYFLVSDSITKNTDNSYTLNNPTAVSYSDWYSSYSTYKGKFTCGNDNATCQNVHFIASPASSSYQYVDSEDTILIAKSRNDLELVNTLTIPKYLLISDFQEYADYKYTCRSLSSTCTENNLSIIISTSDTSLRYIQNYYFGTSVTWDGTYYTLDNIVPIEEYNKINTLSNHHFLCGIGQKKCTQVYYMYKAQESAYPYYYCITLKNGETNPEVAINNMLKKNTHDSVIKAGLEGWYNTFLNDYDEFIEDTIYCNDRSIKTIAGWLPNNNLENDLQFEGYYGNNPYGTAKTLICPNETDQFSIYNNKALLNKKVGLLTSSEWKLAKMTELNNAFEHHWHMTPSHYTTGLEDAYVNQTAMSNTASSFYSRTYSGTSLHYLPVTREGSVRPVISLIPKIRYSSGTGSREDPYVIDYIQYYGIDVEINNETEDLTIEIEDLSKIQEGETVNFKVTPIKGHKITNLRIVDENDNEIEYTTSDNKNYVFTMPSSDVTIIPSYERVKNAVNVEDNINTKEFIIEVNDSKAVVYEDIVRFKVEPEEGYEVDSIDITDEEENKISYEKTNNKNEYEFKMPDTNVLIKPYYKKIEQQENIVNPKTNTMFITIIIVLIISILFGIKIVKRKRRVY